MKKAIFIFIISIFFFLGTITETNAISINLGDLSKVYFDDIELSAIYYNDTLVWLPKKELDTYTHACYWKESSVNTWTIDTTNYDMLATSILYTVIGTQSTANWELYIGSTSGDDDLYYTAFDAIYTESSSAAAGDYENHIISINLNTSNVNTIYVTTKVTISSDNVADDQALFIAMGTLYFKTIDGLNCIPLGN